MIARVARGASAAAAEALRKQGVVLIEQLFAPELIAHVRAAFHAVYPEVRASADLPSDRYRVAPGRYTLPLAFDGSMAEIVLSPELAVIAERTLLDDWVIEAFGAIVALPGAGPHRAHRDGALLFPETGIDAMLPPSALTISIPLVSFDARNGRTTFCPGSHRKLSHDPAAPPFEAPDLEPGDCLIWDFRVLHSGEANSTDAVRSSLYLTCCRPYWIDSENFEPGVNAKLLAGRAALDRLGQHERKRFVRAQVID